jgi:hypothetical protein
MLIVSKYFAEILKYQNSTDIRPVETELLHVDRRTDTQSASDACWQLCETVFSVVYSVSFVFL